MVPRAGAGGGVSATFAQDAASRDCCRDASIQQAVTEFDLFKANILVHRAMCGIWCALSTRQHVWPSNETLQLLERRGPNSSCRSEATCTLEQTGTGRRSSPLYIAFHSTVLSLRGHGTVRQPYRASDSTSTLCWNGEAWEIAGHAQVTRNDTEAVATLLDDVAISVSRGSSRCEFVKFYASLVARALAQIAGPYAFVYHDASNGILFFGRDFLGRRSLLTTRTADGDLLISSVVSVQPESADQPWSEVEANGVHYVDLKSDTQAQKVPYHFANIGAEATTLSVIPRLSLNRISSPPGHRLNADAPSVERLETLLRSSMDRRLANIRLDATLTSNLAVLFSGGLDCTVLARLAHELHPPGETIDLLNVAFENPRAHKGLIANGVDAYEVCPDRITGRASHAELTRVCPGREWNFVAINIPYSETMAHKQRVVTLMHPHNTEMDLSIAYALYFAARGDGAASLSPDASPSTFKTDAKVLLSGLGADELFGGYQRHATGYNRTGFTGLLDELDLDIGRLGKRNLGRDDRVISDWGREARFPFLDEELLAWALAVPVTEKCGFGEPDVQESSDGSELLEPGKKVLRWLAWKLGMRQVAKEKKRAIQFGARTAKMESGKTKGTHVLS